MSEYNTNQDGQWKTSEQWRAEEANDHSNPKKNKNGGRGKYVAKLAASAVAFGLIAGLVMQGVTYGFSRAGIGMVQHSCNNEDNKQQFKYQQ